MSEPTTQELIEWLERMSLTGFLRDEEESERLVVHLARHLGPVEVQAAEEGHHAAADHDVVKVRHDEVGVVQMHVEAHRAEEQARETADEEEAHEAEHPELLKRCLTDYPVSLT